MTEITASVGRDSANKYDDVKIIQKLINRNISSIIPLNELFEDGDVGPVTIGAIEEFQRRVVDLPLPDGRVDPNGKTLLALNENKGSSETIETKKSSNRIMLNPTPIGFMNRYRNLNIDVVVEDDDLQMCKLGSYKVQLKNYFMMNWKEGTNQRNKYNKVTRGSKKDKWFRANKDKIRNAAMGKGAPQDYELALQWAVLSGKISGNITRDKLQAYCDNHLGIDCSGFATNYLIACRKKTYSNEEVRNTSAASYFNRTRLINDPNDIQQGDLLVWLNRRNTVLTGPGHVAVVNSHIPQCREGGNMHVVESTGSPRAFPKLLDSMYTVEKIIEKNDDSPLMILIVRRHGVSGARVAVVRR